MNKMRRKAIRILIGKLMEIKSKLAAGEEIDSLLEDLSDIYDEVDCIRDDEECYMDNMPESLQCSDRGMDSEAAIDSLDEALGYLEEIMDLDDEDEIEVDIDITIESLDDAAV